MGMTMAMAMLTCICVVLHPGDEASNVRSLALGVRVDRWASCGHRCMH